MLPLAAIPVFAEDTAAVTKFYCLDVAAGAEDNKGGLPLFLFAMNFFGEGIMTYPGQRIRFYSCQIYEYSTLVRNFVPAKQEGKFGVYDEVDQKFYEMKGTGTVSGTEYKKIAVPLAVMDLSYNSTEQTGVPAGEGYTIKDTVKTNIGTYNAVASLKEGYIWEDGTTGDKTVQWSISKQKIPASYLDRTVNSDNTVSTTEKLCDGAYLIAKDDSAWGTDGKTTWYAVNGNIPLDNRPVVHGDVRIILMDNATLTANNGITAEGENNSLSFYAQSDKKPETGKLIAVTNGVTAIGGRNGGNGGKKGDSGLYGNDGQNGSTPDDRCVIFGSASIKAGESENKAGNAAAYKGEWYLSVQRSDISTVGSVLSGGSLWVILVIAVAAIGGTAALIFVRKKKPAPAGGTNGDNQ